MQVEAIPMLINSDFLNAPLDVKMHLADYKMYGEDSYVFQQKELLHGLYECTYLSMNDRRINGEALDYFAKNNKHIGEALIAIFDLGRKDVIRSLRTMTTVANSTTAMTAILNSQTAIMAIANSTIAMTTVANSTTAMTAILNSQTAIMAIANSTIAMTTVANSTTAMTAIANSSTAMTAVANSITAMTIILNNIEFTQKVINSDLVREINLIGDTWNNPPREIQVKGIIISFYSSAPNNALTVRKVDDLVITERNDDRNAADANMMGWKIWFARYSKNPLHYVMKKSITVASHYGGSKMRYIPIN